MNVRLLLVAVATSLMAVGCSGPDQCGVPLCPEGTVLSDCDPKDDNCTEHEPGRCSYTCAVAEVSGPCENAAAPADCDDGYYQVEECPDGAECVTKEGCSTEFDRICAPQTDYDAETFYTTCDASGCSPSVPSCSFDEECAIVPAGPVCEPCVEDCASGAVLATDAQNYTTRFAELKEIHCDMPGACAADCIGLVPYCEPTSGTCAAREAVLITTDDVPKDCTVAADCELVFAGEICNPCKCANDAIRADAVDAYNARFDMECSTNTDCSCDPPAVDCVMGVCTAVR